MEKRYVFQIYSRDVDRIVAGFASVNKTVREVIQERDSMSAQEYRDQLVLVSLRAAVKEAYRYAQRYYLWGFLHDFIQEANLGLIEAAKRFNPERAFLPYAKTWMKKQILEFIVANEGIVRVPANKIERFDHLRVILERLTNHLGEKPSETQMLTAGVNFEELKFLEFDPRNKVSLPRVEMATPLFSFLNVESMLATVISLHTQQIITKHLSGKTKPVELECFKMRFGFSPYNESSTFAEIAQQFNLKRDIPRFFVDRIIKDQGFADFIFKLLKSKGKMAKSQGA